MPCSMMMINGRMVHAQWYGPTELATNLDWTDWKELGDWLYRESCDAEENKDDQRADWCKAIIARMREISRRALKRENRTEARAGLYQSDYPPGDLRRKRQIRER